MNNFSKRLCELVPNSDATKELAAYLGCSVQAVNQYKQGTAFPKTENLIKMSDYFDVSVDYLLGRSVVKSRDENIQIAQFTTGLSERAISALMRCSDTTIETINKIILAIGD